MAEVIQPLRSIRSFVRREGRITKAQQRALAEIWPHYGVDTESPLDFPVLFGRTGAVMLEIGFGNGEVLSKLAAAHPQNNYLGIEVHRPGVGNLLLQLDKQGLSNVRLVCADAKLVLQRQIPAASLDGVYLFFPDPWPKTRHHKRRLVQTDFAAMVQACLKPNGTFHLATDWEHYAAHMMEVLSSMPGLENAAGPGRYVGHADYRPLTKFERRGAKLGHKVYDLAFRRVG